MESITQKLQKEIAERKEAILKEITELELSDWTPVKGLPIPFRNQLLILPLVQGDRKTASGLFLRGSGDKATDTKLAVIARLGSDVNLPVKVGSKVLYDAHNNYFQVMGSDGNTYLIVNEHNIFCAVTPETYIIPEFRTNTEKRVDSRREGFANVAKEEKKDAELQQAKEEGQV